MLGIRYVTDHATKSDPKDMNGWFRWQEPHVQWCMHAIMVQCICIPLKPITAAAATSMCNRVP